MIMKKEYIKPEMLVHQISKRSILLTSGGSKKIYSKMGEDEIGDGLRYGGYIEDGQEDNFDPE